MNERRRPLIGQDESGHFFSKDARRKTGVPFFGEGSGSPLGVSPPSTWNAKPHDGEGRASASLPLVWTREKGEERVQGLPYSVTGAA